MGNHGVAASNGELFTLDGNVAIGRLSNSMSYTERGVYEAHGGPNIDLKACIDSTYENV